ncbi:molybdopterin-guanine dinucleotide biosynthesis protein A [Desulfohalotomaculum tongense]|uniref:molybdenum cofactor guanylyltransferase n=1 Tax=Desulforadius tongensis TaxID=1216062 RepID=UPI00195EC18C|nr:molybdenum cofactor guanylyltransferase [Desulforadius tongensis]MBM7854054.1 molybdopterin-guanine dinucleotide biosynthesis protein A [Desulforadius tongensis]
MKASAAILAGGKNSRMGTNKAFLEVQSCRIIDHALHELRRVSEDILIITNNPAEYSHLNVRLAQDIYPGRGPLSGIHSALVNAKNHTLLVVACDMPFIEAELARYLINAARDYDVVIPVVEGYFEPLFAVYTKACLPPIEWCFRKEKLRVIDFFSALKVKYVNEDEISRVADVERVFYNVNTPKELAAAKKLMHND